MSRVEDERIGVDETESRAFGITTTATVTALRTTHNTRRFTCQGEFSLTVMQAWLVAGIGDLLIHTISLYYSYYVYLSFTYEVIRG